MNNFFLLHEALNTTTVPQLEAGIVALNDISIAKSSSTDQFYYHDSLWAYDCGHGEFSTFYYAVISKETQRLIPLIFQKFDKHFRYVNSEKLLDEDFPNACNGFLGFDFSSTAISPPRQINSISSFETFKQSCLDKHAENSIESFWDYREELFPNLIFCDQVKDQIAHLSIQDDRFKLIKNKLTIMNQFAGTWTAGIFNHKALGLDCTPDSPKRIADTLQLRTFVCKGIGNQVFSLHVKWYFGSEPFRLYFFPQESNRKLHIGYIGDKDGIGF